MLLDELAIKFGTDKSSQGHNYTAVYEPLFEPIRYQGLTLLELGWGGYDPQRQDHADPNLGGASAAMWREYFPHASVNIVDIEPKNNTIDGVTLFTGSQDDPDFLADVHRRTGDYDIIIDDASHIGGLTWTSFTILWKWLKPGGIYIVEDLEQSYHAHYPPYRNDANPDPDKPSRNGPTIMQRLKNLADDTNRAILQPEYQKTRRTIDSITFYQQIAVIRKAP